MKKTDILFLSFLIVLIGPFIIFTEVYDFYDIFNRSHPYWASFIKFAILATIGELIGQRIRSGYYYHKGFGIIPRAIVWGFLGIMIKMAFVIFGSGAPQMLASMGVQYPGDVAADILKSSILESRSWLHFWSALAVSTTLNLFFAPVFMTFHKITDEHIRKTGGTLKGFFSPIPFGEIMISLNWKVMWNFVFKKTIPLFWIPMQTITFMLHPDYRILFAAFLSIVLGVLLAIASLMSHNK